VGHEEGAVVMVEHPQPPASLADPQAGFIRADRRSRKQAGADRRARRGEMAARRFEDVDERAFADLDAMTSNSSRDSRSNPMPWVKRR